MRSWISLVLAACLQGATLVAAQGEPAVQVARPLASTDAPVASEAEPSATTQAEYREIVSRAISEFELGHAAEARALFLRAHALWPSARTRRTLGMTAFELRMYPRALEELQGALDDPRRPLPPEQRAHVLDLLEKTKAFVGRYRLQLEPADAELRVDGTRLATAGVIVLGVGVHQLTVRATGHNDAYRELVVQGGEDESLQFQLARVRTSEPEPPPAAKIAQPAPPLTRVQSTGEPNRIPAIVAFGVAGLGVAVGTTSGIIAFTKKHDADHTAGYRAADISTSAWIVAGAAGLTGVLLWVLASDSQPERAALHPVVGVGLIGLAGTL